MRIFYHINMTGDHEQSDIISIGMTADNGLSGYAEVNDYDEGKVDQEADEEIVSKLLGSSGMEELITTRKKSKGIIAPMFRVNEWVNGFLSPYKIIKLIGFAGKPQLKAMADMIDLENASKEVSFVNLAGDMVAKHIDLSDNVAVELPEGNALRTAIFLKHIARKYER